MAKHHLLREACLYGLADTEISASEDSGYFFGRVNTHAPRLYFPAMPTHSAHMISHYDGGVNRLLIYGRGIRVGALFVRDTRYAN